MADLAEIIVGITGPAMHEQQRLSDTLIDVVEGRSARKIGVLGQLWATFQEMFFPYSVRTGSSISTVRFIEAKACSGVFDSLITEAT